MAEQYLKSDEAGFISKKTSLRWEHDEIQYWGPQNSATTEGVGQNHTSYCKVYTQRKYALFGKKQQLKNLQ